MGLLDGGMRCLRIGVYRTFLSFALCVHKDPKVLSCAVFIRLLLQPSLIRIQHSGVHSTKHWMCSICSGGTDIMNTANRVLAENVKDFLFGVNVSARLLCKHDDVSIGRRRWCSYRMEESHPEANNVKNHTDSQSDAMRWCENVTRQWCNFNKADTCENSITTSFWCEKMCEHTRGLFYTLSCVFGNLYVCTNIFVYA